MRSGPVSSTTRLGTFTKARFELGRAGRRPAVFLVTALGALMASLDLSIENVAFPALEHTFSPDSQARLAWLVAGYSIVLDSLLVVAGRTADRLGSRRVFLAVLGVFCLGSLLRGIASGGGHVRRHRCASCGHGTVSRCRRAGRVRLARCILREPARWPGGMDGRSPGARGARPDSSLGHTRLPGRRATGRWSLRSGPDDLA